MSRPIIEISLNETPDDDDSWCEHYGYYEDFDAAIADLYRLKEEFENRQGEEE